MPKPTYHSLYPSFFKLDGGAMFGIIPKPLWEKKIKADDLNRIQMNCRIFYIKVDNKHILIDLGVGAYHHEKFNSRFGLNEDENYVESILNKHHKIGCKDITDIVISHLHFDHVGGLGTQDGHQPLFPNATLHLHKSHFEYSQKPTPRDQGSFHKHFFLNLIQKYYIEKNQVNWLTEDKEGEILTTSSGYCLNYKTSFGHTPFQVLPFDDSMIFLADLVPTTHHIGLAWSMGYDLHPGESSLERKAIFDFILEKKLTMIFDHDKDFWGAKLQKNADEYGFLETFPVTSTEHETHSIGE